MNNSPKDILRITYKASRKKLAPEAQIEKSKLICARIQTLDLYQKAKNIALYWPIQGEVDLRSLWLDDDDKSFYFPKINEDSTLSFLMATKDTRFIENKFQIKEPNTDQAKRLSADELDLIITPLLAFDDRGTRLGMGAGYYDRTLTAAGDTILIGAAYEFQHQAYIAPDSWDIPLSAIVTEERVYLAKPIDKE